MIEKKEITIKKTSINKFLKDLVVAFLISITTLLIIQHFGDIENITRGDIVNGRYGFSSPIGNNMYYYPVNGKYFHTKPSYLDELWFFYLPSIFVEGYFLLFVTIVITIIVIKLKGKFKVIKKTTTLLNLIISGSVAVFFMYFFKKPNKELLEKGLNLNSKWQRDDYFEIIRQKEDFFSLKYFDLNILVGLSIGIIVFLIVYLILKKKKLIFNFLKAN